MPNYFTPGIYFEKIDPAAREVRGIRTDIPGFAGIAEKGPLHTPIRIESWKQFQALFGNYIPQAYLAYAVQGFFENGGEVCYITRITDTDKARCSEVLLFNKSEKTVLLTEGVHTGTSELPLSSTTQIEVDDFVLIGNSAEYYQVSAKTPDTISITPALTKAYKKNTYVKKVLPALKIRALNEGQWGKKCKVFLSTCTLGSTMTADPAKQAPDKSFSVVKTIQGFEPGSLVKVFQKNGSIAVEKYHYVGSVDKGSKTIVWDTILEPGFTLNEPLYLSTLEFTLKVMYEDRIKEVFKGLSLNPLYKNRYVENVVKNDSYFISAIDLYKLNYLGTLISMKYGNQYTEQINNKTLILDDLLTPEEIKTNLPGPGDMAQGMPDPGKLYKGYTFLKGGFDGINTIEIDDFLHDPLSRQKRGLECFNDVDEISMVCIPDLMIRLTDYELISKEEKTDPCASPGEEPRPSPFIKEYPPEFSLDDIELAQHKLIEHCELLKNRIALLDPPYQSDVSSIFEWRLHFDSSYAALYYPWILVNDPLRIKGNITRSIPPSGHIAGVFAKTDLQKGVHKAPANEQILGVRDVAVKIENNQQDTLNPAGINCLRIFPGKGIRIWGTRTISSNTTWRYINIRRLLIMIEESIEQAMHWAVFEPHTMYLRNEIIMTASSFLTGLWKKGALAGNTKEEAFFVKCDNENNPRESIDQGKIMTDIGVAPSIPAEFIVFRIGKIKDKIEIEEEEAL